MQIGDVIAVPSDQETFTIYRIIDFEADTPIGDLIHCLEFPDVAESSKPQSFNDLSLDDADFSTMIDRSFLNEGETLFNHPIQQGERGSFISHMRDTNPIYYALLENIDTEKINHDTIRKYAQSDELLERTSYKKAIALLNEVIDLEPEFAKAYELRGTAHSALWEHDAAITNFETALKYNPELKDSVYGLGWSLARKGDSTRAREILLEGMQKWPDSPSFASCLETIPDPPWLRCLLLFSALLLINIPVVALYLLFNNVSELNQISRLAPIAYYGAVACLLTVFLLYVGPRLDIENRLRIPKRYRKYTTSATVIIFVIGFILMAIGKWYDIL